MQNDSYEKLRQILDTHPSGAPASKYFDQILRMYFTPEEAELLCRLSFRGKTVNEIIKGSDLDAAEVEKTLDAISSKALIFSKTGKSGKSIRRQVSCRY